MESLLSWREYKARMENERQRREIPVVSRVMKNSLLDIPMPGRVVVIAKLRYKMLLGKLGNVRTDSQRENFVYERDLWFAWLKNSMRDYKLSKEYLSSFGLDWNECKKFAYGS